MLNTMPGYNISKYMQSDTLAMVLLAWRDTCIITHKYSKYKQYMSMWGDSWAGAGAQACLAWEAVCCLLSAKVMLPR